MKTTPPPPSAPPTQAPAEPAYQLVSTAWLKEAVPAHETAKQLQDQMLRMRADFDNSRKRLLKDKDDSVKFANEGLLFDLLPVLDNFELGMKAVTSASDLSSVTQGINMIFVQLQKFMTDMGVKPVDAVGQIFDPHLHEAVDQKFDNAIPDGTIIAQHRKGYMFHDRLLRPASVVVAHHTNHPQPAETQPKT